MCYALNCNLFVNYVVMGLANTRNRVSIAQAELIRHVLIEQIEHVLIVHTLRRSRQTKQEFGFKITDNSLICFGSCVVAFVDDDITYRVSLP